MAFGNNDFRRGPVNVDVITLNIKMTNLAKNPYTPPSPSAAPNHRPTVRSFLAVPNLSVSALGALVGFWLSLVIPHWFSSAVHRFDLPTLTNITFAVIILTTPLVLALVSAILGKRYFNAHMVKRTSYFTGITAGCMIAIAFVLLGGSGYYLVWPR